MKKISDAGSKTSTFYKYDDNLSWDSIIGLIAQGSSLVSSKLGKKREINGSHCMSEEENKGLLTLGIGVREAVCCRNLFSAVLTL